MTPSPITFTRAYQTSDGKCVATLEQAQEIEITKLLGDHATAAGEDVAKLIVSNKDAIMAILTLSDASRPKARGAKKPRVVKEPKTAVAP